MLQGKSRQRKIRMLLSNSSYLCHLFSTRLFLTADEISSFFDSQELLWVGLTKMFSCFLFFRFGFKQVKILKLTYHIPWHTWVKIKQKLSHIATIIPSSIVAVYYVLSQRGPKGALSSSHSETPPRVRPTMLLHSNAVLSIWQSSGIPGMIRFRQLRIGIQKLIN